ncbi:MAG: TonB family protein [Reyranellaceae bacterium]
MAALALSLDPRGRQPRGISGRHAAPPAPDLERARDSSQDAGAQERPGLTPSRGDRATFLATLASLALHAVVAGAALAAFGGETMGGGGSGQGDGEGSGILVELVALAPAHPAVAVPDSASEDAEPAMENREAEAPKPVEQTMRQKIVLPPRPVDAEAIPLNVPPPPKVETAKVEERKPVEKPKEVQARREAPKPTPARAKEKPDPRREPPQQAQPARSERAVAADTAAAQTGAQQVAGAAGQAALGGAGGDQIAAVGGMGARVLQARFRVTPDPPHYPRRALSQRQEGTVMIRALIGESGEARQIRLHASSGYPLLDKAALQAVGEWRFAPETVNGRPVAVWVEVPVRFKID